MVQWKGMFLIMKVRELLAQCDANKIYHFIKENKDIYGFSKTEFKKKMKALLANVDEPTQEFVLIYTPHIAVGGTASDRDLFLVHPSEVNDLIISKKKALDIMMCCSRCECDMTSVSNVLNAEICPLSLKSFYDYEICAETFFALAISPQEVAEYNTCATAHLIQHARDVITHENVPSKVKISERTKNLCRDIDASLAQNTLIYYPYYVSVASMVP